MKPRIYIVVASIIGVALFTMLLRAIDHKEQKHAPRPEFEGYLADSSRCGNNHYDLMVYQNYFIVMDGNRVVDTLPFGKNGQLDTVILKDNR